MRKHLCCRYVGAASSLEAVDPYEAAESLQTLAGRVAALATLAASGEPNLLPGNLHSELLGLLAELAQTANDAAEELAESLAAWLNRTGGLK
jgi:hypothetical protein